MKIKACKEAAAPSQRRFALARIIVCCGASIVSSTTLGDIDALAALKEQMEAGKK